jgi:transposase
MESTGVYWIAPHEVLEKDFEVPLVNTRQLARVPGRNKKTDRATVSRFNGCTVAGLLNKANLVAESADCVRRKQKSLDQMNVRVHRAVSHLDGVTGMAIVRRGRGRARCPETSAIADRRWLGRERGCWPIGRWCTCPLLGGKLTPFER